jgi:hypothetical protein
LVKGKCKEEGDEESRSWTPRRSRGEVVDTAPEKKAAIILVDPDTVILEMCGHRRRRRRS